MSQLLLWGMLGLATLAAGIGYVLYRELKNQHHIWHDPCVTPHETREDIRAVLLQFRRVMDGRNIVWWIDYGTLLGAWRLGDVMAFDHDLDISFLSTDADKMRAAKPEMEAAGIIWNEEHTSLFYKGRKIGDLEPWFEHGGKLCRDDPAKRDATMRFWRWLVDDFPVEQVKPLWSLRLHGEMFPCPNHPDRYLRRRYLSCRISLRLVYPHKQRCWRDKAFWEEARRIRRCKTAPDIVRQPPLGHGSAVH